jgi:hypothetical protein
LLVINSAGNVGIGTSTVNTTLEVLNSSAPIIRVGDGTRHMELRGGSTTQNAAIGTNYAGGFDIIQNGSAAVTIDTSKRLLVGTSSTSSNTTLLLQGYSGTTGPGVLRCCTTTNGPTSTEDLGYIMFGDATHVNAAWIQAQRDGGTWTAGSSYPGRLVFSTTADGASSPTERMRISSDGSLYIGGTISTLATNTISSAYAGDTGRWVYNGKSTVSVLDINQTFDDTDARNAIRFYRNETEVGSVSVSTTATSYNTSSDYRLKENVTAVTDGITRLRQLKPSRFNFKADPSHTVDGFIAHETQAVVPEAVTGSKDAVDDDGNPVYQGIDQSKLVPLLTAALQEAIGEIESLKARVAALEAN